MTMTHEEIEMWEQALDRMGIHPTPEQALEMYNSAPPQSPSLPMLRLWLRASGVQIDDTRTTN